MTALGCFSSLLDWRWITTALVFLVTYLLGRFYNHVSKYPKGPFPLPLVGNLLEVLRSDAPLSERWSSVPKHSIKDCVPTIVFFTTYEPMVMLNSYAVIREALVERRHDFAGRFPTRTGAIQNRGNHDILFEDYNPRFKALRKVALSACRIRYIGLSSYVASCASVLSHKTPISFLREVFSDNCRNVLTRLHEEKDDIERLENINRRFYEISPNGLPSDIAPFLAVLYLKKEKRMAAVFRDLSEILHRLFSKAEASYVSGKTENFTHAMLAAREEALKEDKSDAQYLTKANMILVTVDLFGGSRTAAAKLTPASSVQNNTTQRRILKYLPHCCSSSWSMPPVYGDREKLPFTVACLLETLRMHPCGASWNTS
ncbi:hypothetical protein HPB52_019928 [Rhipicephalus sanguineus]|uniref:Cytochrome P450 n=1 Tax=Rhipicephalus sanguineus TaxID=34632 RepID=A0A9D4Q2H5_RHISA|nr:hypothetical protein HPB52_019928 [Rhipicephalus sanguineus]